MDLFTYGSLILPEVWDAVTGAPQDSEPGVIRGYIRRTISGASFPGIVFTGDPNDRVAGLIYRDVDAIALELLDEFESDFYVREEIDVHCVDGNTLTCGAYVVPPENAALLSAKAWDLETFTSQHLQSFLERNFS